MTADDALDIPAALWKRRWLIILLVLVASLGALAASLLQPKTYVSSAKVWVKPTAINPPGSVPLANTIDLATEAELVQSHSVAEAAALKTHQDSPVAMLEHVSVITPPEGQVLTITYSAADPMAAATGAEGFADAYLEYRTDQAIQQISEAIATADEQMAGLQEEVDRLTKLLGDTDPDSAPGMDLANQLDQANGQLAIWMNSASVLNVSAVDAGSILVPARPPANPASPDPLADAARGALAGLVLGIIAALIVESSARAKERSS